MSLCISHHGSTNSVLHAVSHQQGSGLLPQLPVCGEPLHLPQLQITFTQALGTSLVLGAFPGFSFQLQSSACSVQASSVRAPVPVQVCGVPAPCANWGRPGQARDPTMHCNATLADLVWLKHHHRQRRRPGSPWAKLAAASAPPAEQSQPAARPGLAQSAPVKPEPQLSRFARDQPLAAQARQAGSSSGAQQAPRQQAAAETKPSAAALQRAAAPAAVPGGAANSQPAASLPDPPAHLLRDVVSARLHSCPSTGT